MEVLLVSALAGWPGAIAAAAQEAPADRGVPWIAFAILGLYVAVVVGVFLMLQYRLRRPLVIRSLPFTVAYELERLAERERRSLDQQAVALMEEALEARERARYGRAGAYGARGGELKPAV